jgi:hypothetical protein
MSPATKAREEGQFLVKSHLWLAFGKFAALAGVIIAAVSAASIPVRFYITDGERRAAVAEHPEMRSYFTGHGTGLLTSGLPSSHEIIHSGITWAAFGGSIALLGVLFTACFAILLGMPGRALATGLTNLIMDEMER